MEQIIKKEDKLEYKGGGIFKKRGALVLTMDSVYFDAKGKKLFEIPLKDIVSANSKRGIGNGVDWLIITYNNAGKEQKAQIMHFGFLTGIGLGILSRVGQLYFSSWEKIIDDARFGRNITGNSNMDDLEKLAELKAKGIIDEDEFKAKKKQLLGL